MLDSCGIRLVSGLAESEFARLVGSYGELYQHPDANEGSTTVIVPDGRLAAAGLGFTRSRLALHTDRSSLPLPPRYVAMYMRQHDPFCGGNPKFADVQMAVSSINTEDLEKVTIRETGTERSVPLLVNSTSRAIRYRDDGFWTLDGPRALVRELRRRVELLTLEVDWLRSGDGYIVDNHRFIHGRTEIRSRDRAVVRFLVNAAR
jgi:alpha-ketoglutarate-dependent taurine dioxygenase